MNTKQLYEKLNELKAENRSLAETAVTETRDFNEQEKADFAARSAEIERLEETIKMIENIPVETETRAVEAVEDIETAEIRAFAEYIRENRANTMTASANGAVIPASIAKKIIAEVYEVCPILRDANRYTVKGKLSIPVYDETTTAITVAWASDGSALSSNAGQLLSVDLSGLLAGALVKVGKQLINNTDFDLVDFVVNRMALALGRFIENKMLNGSGESDEFTGMVNATYGFETASATAITMDELIEAQSYMPSSLQDKACWIMHPSTFIKIKKLKDSVNSYYLNPDPRSGYTWNLLGKPVYLSDNMPEMAADTVFAFYCNPSCVAVKMPTEMEINVLRERFADEHCVGIVGYVEFACEIEQKQGVIAIEGKSSTT